MSTGFTYANVGWVEEDPNDGLGTITINVAGPLTITGSPASLNGPPIVITNTALESIPTDSWKAGTLSATGGPRSVSVGHDSNTIVSDSVSLGYRAQSGFKSTAIGASTNAALPRSVAIGDDAEGASTEVTLVGASTISFSPGAVVLGYQANVQASSTCAIAIGQLANIQISSQKSIALGYSATSYHPSEIIIGENATSLNSLAPSGGIAIGQGATTTGGTAVGPGSYATDTSAVLGRNANSANAYAVAVGEDSTVRAYGIALGYGADATIDYCSSIGPSVVNTEVNTTLVGNRNHPSPYDHLLKSDGYLASRRQRFGKYLSLNNIPNLGISFFNFTVEQEEVAPNNFLFGGSIFQFKQDTECTFLIIMRLKAFQPGTTTACPIIFTQRLEYYNAATAVPIVYTTYGINKDNLADNYETQHTITAMIHTSNTVGDYFMCAVDIIATPGNPSVDFNVAVEICRLN